MSANPLLVHVHIHKCAGRSFGALIERSFGTRHLNMYRTNPFASYTPAELDAALARAPRVLSIASHNFRIFPETIAGRRALYVCFLRRPLDWFVSYLTYVQADWARLSAAHKSTLPPDAHTLPLADLAQYVVESHTRQPKTYSTFVRYLAESTYRHQLAQWMVLPAWDEPLVGPAARLFEERGLEMAQRILDRFFFVGIVEEMDRSVNLLRCRLKHEGLDLLEQPIEHRNVTRHLRDDLHWLDESHPTGRAVRTLLADSERLYEWAQQRLHDQLQVSDHAQAG